MKTSKTVSYFATITIGLHKGYEGELYSKEELIKAIQSYQKALIKDEHIFLSASISECLIVLNKQLEPHLKLEFINYPKFPLNEGLFKSQINKLGQFLMKQFQQNRIVIVYHDETVMFEFEDKIDFRINQ